MRACYIPLGHIAPKTQGALDLAGDGGETSSGGAPKQIAFDKAVALPQTEALGIVQETDDARYKMIGLPLSFDGVRPKQHHGPPELGAHNAEVFGDEKP